MSANTPNWRFVLIGALLTAVIAGFAVVGLAALVVFALA